MVRKLLARIDEGSKGLTVLCVRLTTAPIVYMAQWTVHTCTLCQVCEAGKQCGDESAWDEVNAFVGLSCKSLLLFSLADTCSVAASSLDCEGYICNM